MTDNLFMFLVIMTPYLFKCDSVTGAIVELLIPKELCRKVQGQISSSTIFCAAFILKLSNSAIMESFA